MSQNPIQLSQGQLDLIAKRYGISAGVSLADIGCGNGEWVQQWIRRGAKVQGLEEASRMTAVVGEGISAGSPAASLPYAVHSLDRVLFRGTSAYTQSAFHPELMIALANMGSLLKPHGRLVIPVSNEAEAERWTSMLSIFPGAVRIRQLSSGISAYLTLSFLFGGAHKVTVVDLNIQDKQVSRLEWHRLAREAVLKQTQTPNAA